MAVNYDMVRADGQFAGYRQWELGFDTTPATDETLNEWADDEANDYCEDGLEDDKYAHQVFAEGYITGYHSALEVYPSGNRPR